jgi:hypothetical protein
MMTTTTTVTVSTIATTLTQSKIGSVKPPIPEKPKVPARRITKKTDSQETTATTETLNKPSLNSNELTSEKSTEETETIKFTLNNEDNDEDNVGQDSIASVVQRVLSEIVSLVETEYNHTEITDAVQSEENEQNLISSDEEDEYEQEQETNKEETKAVPVDESDGRYLIDTCLVHLKQLCYTFFTHHMFISDTSVSGIEEQISKSFASLFDPEAINASKNETDNRPVLDDQANYLSILSTVNFTKLKPESLTYLQSFQILNKLLIKMLFFPREPSSSKSNLAQELSTESADGSENDVANSENEKFFRSFEHWLKSLFVISCASQFATHTASVHSKLFEFQSVTLNTIIELIHLSESVNSHFSSGVSNQPPVSLVISSNRVIFIL